MQHSRFPRSSKYNPSWLHAGVSGGANPLWLTEWLTEAIDLQPKMRILDLGCGRAVSSIFLAQEFGVQVWATDLWFNATENRQRIEDAGVSDRVFPIHADARSLPFANEFFDVITSIDSFFYYGTDDHYLGYLARVLKPNGVLGIAGAGLTQEIEGEIPTHLQAWWEPSLACIHSAKWWQRHWARSTLVNVLHADHLEDGWQYWLKWHQTICPDNQTEIQALEADRGEYLTYVRATAKRKPNAKLEEPITTIPTEYSKHPLLGGG